MHTTAPRLAGRALLLALWLVLRAAPALADGRIEGRVATPDGAGLSGVTVAVDGTSMSTLTDAEGRFAFPGVRRGMYGLTLALGLNTVTIENVRVDDNTVSVERTVNWKAGYAETVTAYAAFRRTERLTEAPASVTVLTAQTIGLETAPAQLPQALESVVGLESTQSGVFDFNVNIRGLNSSLNRRVLMLVDGRDPASVLIGAQEWATFALPLDEIARVEVVRGPASALYGTNAFNGIIDITSKEPRYAQGGNVQASIGEVGTTRLSARYGGALNRGWFYRAQTAFGRTDDFYVSRHGSVEYPGLPMEAVDPARDHTMFANAGARLDHYRSDGSRLTFEGGWSRADGNMFITNAGRLQSLGSNRPWVRSAFQTANWQVSAYYDGRIGQMLSLAPGTTIFDDSAKINVEAQRRFDYASGRGRLVAGGMYRFERADTRDGSGISTILRDVEVAHEGAGFAQVDQPLRDDLKLVVAARLDASSLHGPEVSPKVGLVYAATPTHGLRFTYSHAFETGSLVHYFTRAAAAPPLRLGAVEAALKPFLGGVPLNLDTVPVLALGNEDLSVEKVDSVEGGYSGVLGRRLMIGADYYFNRITNLITPLLPQVGTELGRINPTYGPYSPPAALSPQQQALVLATLRTVLPPPVYASMSNDLDGSPIVAAASYTNFSRVNLQGAELSVQYFPNDRLFVDAGYAAIGFHPVRALTAELISANAPQHRVTAGVSHSYGRLTAGARYRWSSEFTWSGGVFKGPVPAASIVDLTARYTLTPRTAIVGNVANLFDNEHYEIFGGDILRRRAIASVVHSW
jgi:outer membrane receptor protein involved in Fe transport